MIIFPYWQFPSSWTSDFPSKDLKFMSLRKMLLKVGFLKFITKIILSLKKNQKLEPNLYEPINFKLYGIKCYYLFTWFKQVYRIRIYIDDIVTRFQLESNIASMQLFQTIINHWYENQWSRKFILFFCCLVILWSS